MNQTEEIWQSLNNQSHCPSLHMFTFYFPPFYLFLEQLKMTEYFQGKKIFFYIRNKINGLLGCFLIKKWFE